MYFHEIISTNILNFIDYIYYNKIIILYNNNLINLLNNSSYPILKPEFLLYLQYYFIYTFLYYKNFLMNFFALHSIYISGLVFEKFCLKFNYVSKNNVNVLKENSYFLFLYLLGIKIIYFKINFFKKFLLSILLFSFFTIMNINYIYKERLKYIKLKKDFRHPLKIFIISPSKLFIENIIIKTQYFTYENFLYLINICFFIFK